jgi:hypothetical protein
MSANGVNSDSGKAEIDTVGVSIHLSASVCPYFDYCSDSAVAVEEGATVDIVTEAVMLIAISILALFCWLLFALAVNALPFFVGATALLAAYQSGAGPVGAIVVGPFVSAALLAGGQRAIAAARSPQLRTAIIFLFAAPAAIAGYHVIRGLARFSASSEPWQDVFAIVGAITVGATAWARMTLASPNVDRRAFARSSAPPIASVNKDE